MGQKKSNPPPPNIENKPPSPPPPPPLPSGRTGRKIYSEMTIPFEKFKDLLVDFLCNAIPVNNEDIIKIKHTSNEINIIIKLEKK